MNSEQEFLVGIDGGGTKCRAVIFDRSGKQLGAGVAGPANIARIGCGALDAIMDSVLLAIANSDIVPDGQSSASLLSKCHVSAGLAGATVAASVTILNNWQHPFASFRFTSDLHAALVGAHGGENGAVLVVGTGSCSAALVDNSFAQFGGHGFVIGDKGSGAWFGVQAVQTTLEALDGVVAKSLLTERVCAFYDAWDTASFVNILNGAPSSEFARVASEVFACGEHNDASARAIIRRGTDYLSAIAATALARSEAELALVGGLAETVKPLLSAEVRSKITPARYGAEWGAVHAVLAQKD